MEKILILGIWSFGGSSTVSLLLEKKNFIIGTFRRRKNVLFQEHLKKINNKNYKEYKIDFGSPIPSIVWNRNMDDSLQQRSHGLFEARQFLHLCERYPECGVDGPHHNLCERNALGFEYPHQRSTDQASISHGRMDRYEPRCNGNRHIKLQAIQFGKHSECRRSA